MIGMGLTFAAAAGVFFGVIAVVLGRFFPGVEDAGWELRAMAL